MGYLDLALSYSNPTQTVEAPASGGGLRSFISLARFNLTTAWILMLNLFFCEIT